MKVEVKFTIDLEKMYELNKNNILMPESYDKMVQELNDIYMEDMEQNMSKDAQLLFEEEFTNIFNY